MAIGRIIESWRRLGFNTKGWKSAMDIAAIKRVFQLRNKLMHRGEVGLEQSECAKLAQAVQTLIV